MILYIICIRLVLRSLRDHFALPILTGWYLNAFVFGPLWVCVGSVFISANEFEYIQPFVGLLLRLLFVLVIKVM